MGLFDEIKPPPPGSQDFTETTRTRLSEFPEIQPFLRILEIQCRFAVGLPEIPNTSEVRRELKGLRDSLNTFVKKADSANSVLGSFIRVVASERKDLYPKYADDNGSLESSKLNEFLVDATTIVDLLSATLEQSPPTRGPSRKPRPLFFASVVLQDLCSNGIDATTYEDGVYFRLLDILFEQYFSDLGSEAYQRYGRNALKTGGSKKEK
jgi:hypothetical protein